MALQTAQFHQSLAVDSGLLASLPQRHTLYACSTHADLCEN